MIEETEARTARQTHLDEVNQELGERPAEIRDWWMAKHPGACPECGSHDGMASWYRGEEPPAGRQWYRLPGRDDVVFTRCPFCHSDPDGYTLMDARLLPTASSGVSAAKGVL